MKYFLYFLENTVTSGDQFMGGGEKVTIPHSEYFDSLTKAQEKLKMIKSWNNPEYCNFKIFQAIEINV